MWMIECGTENVDWVGYGAVGLNDGIGADLAGDCGGLWVLVWFERGLGI